MLLVSIPLRPLNARTPMLMSKPIGYFADTTIAYYRLHGHPLHKEAVAEFWRHGTVSISNFVRGEYIRGYVIGLIELFSAIKEENSVENGILAFNAEMGTRRQFRMVANALQSTTSWLAGMEDWREVPKT